MSIEESNKAFIEMQRQVKKQLKQGTKNQLIAIIQQLLIDKYYLTEQVKGLTDAKTNDSISSPALSQSEPQPGESENNP